MQNLINTPNTTTPASQPVFNMDIMPPLRTPAATPMQPQMSNSPEMNQKGSMKKLSGLFIALCLVAIAGGGATGAGIYKLNAKGSTPGTFEGQSIQTVAGDNVTNGQVFGSPNENDFKDSAEGYLEIGGLDGEGSHKLLRDGGVSQTVYLTSSVTDLDKFKGMKVKVWGETFKAQKAGWLMDVGRVKVIETKAEPPAAAAGTGAKNAKPAADQGD